MLQTIYLRKWTDNFTTSEIALLALEQWKKGLAGINDESIEKALDYCRINLEWPPSIAEFIRYCERADGVPSLEECFTKAVRKEMTHPIIVMVYDKIGSWAMSRDSEVELRKKFKIAYEEAIRIYRESKANASLTTREIEHD